MNKNFHKKIFGILMIAIILISNFSFINFASGQVGKGNEYTKQLAVNVTGNRATTNSSTGSGASDTGSGSASDSSTGSGTTNPGSKAIPAREEVEKTEEEVSKGGAIPVGSQAEASSAEQEALTNAVSCTIGTILAGAMTAIITIAIEQIITAIGGVLNIAPLEKKQVPVDPEEHRRAEIAVWTVMGIPIIPSWNSMAYCLANTLIIYVADSTIAWIQSGFEGKPVFADDPTKLFQDIADYEMSTFLESLGGGFLCEPFEAYITLNLVNSYTQDFSTEGRCTLDTVSTNMDAFLSGETFSYNTWFSMTQNPANNPYGGSLMTQEAARNSIEFGIGPVKQDLDWSNGYFSWKIKDGPNAGKTFTPGTAIVSQLEDRLGLAGDRLVLAEKFDQVISTLVNYLIKTVLTETLGTIKEASR